MEALLGLIPCMGFIGVILLFLLFSSIKVVQEYERGVIFRLGRFVGAKGPGLFFIVPFIDKMMKVDLISAGTNGGLLALQQFWYSLSPGQQLIWLVFSTLFSTSTMIGSMRPGRHFI